MNREAKTKKFKDVYQITLKYRKVWEINTGVYSELCQTYNMEHFVKIATG